MKQDPPKIDSFTLEELKKYKFSNFPENWMLIPEVKEDFYENKYFEVELSLNNFDFEPGSVINLNWEHSRWELYNPLSQIPMRYALDYLIRQVIKISMESEDFRIGVTGYFESDLDYKFMDIDFIPNVQDKEYDIQDFYSSNQDREISLAFRLNNEKKQDIKLFDLYSKVINLLKNIISKLDLFNEHIITSRKEFINRTVSLKDYTFPYLLSQYNSAITNIDKGKSLEELITFFLGKIKGFSIKERVRTSNEEIDMVIYNNSLSSPWKKESNFILVECKNRKDKANKNDYTSFIRKLENRSGRCEIGIFISTSGYTKGFFTERLRDSKNRYLVLDILTSQIVDCLTEGKETPNEFLEKEYIRASLL